MAYATYTTEAFVCGTWQRNTSDKSYLLFTREAGMLYADARSVREEKSKQRYSLQDFSVIRVSLVKGKGGWRIGSVEAINNHYSAALTKTARGSVVASYRFLKRFYNGEEAAPELFDYLNDALQKLARNKTEQTAAEKVVQLRILSDLGYVNKSKLPPIISAPLPAEVTLSAGELKQIEYLYLQATDSSQL